MKRFLVICLFVLAVVPQAFAEDKSNQLAEKLLKTMKIEDSVEQVRRLQRQQIESLGLPEDQKAKSDQILDLIDQNLGWSALKGEIIGLYTETFSQKELEGLVDFYSSDVGQTFIEKMPQLNRKIMMISRERAQTILPEVQSILQEVKAQELEQAQ